MSSLSPRANQAAPAVALSTCRPGDCVCSTKRQAGGAEPDQPYALVPGQPDLNPLCYQLPNSSYAELTQRVDITVRRHTKHAGGCADFGFTTFIANDPILKAAKLFRKQIVA